MGIFYDRFCELCVENNTSPTAAAISIGLSNAAATGWANGTKPRETTIRKLAQKFGVSTAYLKGESEIRDSKTNADSESKKENPATNGDEVLSAKQIEMIEKIKGMSKEEFDKKFAALSAIFDI